MPLSIDPIKIQHLNYTNADEGDLVDLVLEDDSTLRVWLHYDTFLGFSYTPKFFLDDSRIPDWFKDQALVATTAHLERMEVADAREGIVWRTLRAYGERPDEELSMTDWLMDLLTHNVEIFTAVLEVGRAPEGYFNGIAKDQGNAYYHSVAGVWNAPSAIAHIVPVTD